MIFNTNLNANRNSMYDSTIKNLEKAQEILDSRYQNKNISSDEYIKKSKEISEKLRKLKELTGNF